MGLSREGILGNLIPGGFSRSRNYVYPDSTIRHMSRGGGWGGGEGMKRKEQLTEWRTHVYRTPAEQRVSFALTTAPGIRYHCFLFIGEKPEAEKG